jgi:hypothetical protein
LFSEYFLAEHEASTSEDCQFGSELASPADKEVMERWLKTLKENACKPERLSM